MCVFSRSPPELWNKPLPSPVSPLHLIIKLFIYQLHPSLTGEKNRHLHRKNNEDEGEKRSERCGGEKERG